MVFRFFGVDSGAGPEFDKMAGKADLTSKAIKGLALGVATASAAVGIESIRMAANFQTATERIHTQADASNQRVDALRKGILAMSGAVASTPDVLADAAFHIASVGQNSWSTAKQLAVLKVAAEGAKIGGADLTDVTNALDAAVISGIPGVKNFSQAMGELNATVGAGDMTMQNLADALGTGVLGVIGHFGVSLKQAGAALAVFGDNNIRGAGAGTLLRMSVQQLTKPLSTAGDALAELGLKGKNAFSHFGEELQKGGLTKALDDLHERLVKAGDTGKREGEVLTQAFGSRSSRGLVLLEGELDRFHNKLGELGKGGSHFGQDWQGYTKTFGYALDSAKSAGESLLVTLGDKLLPSATKLMNFIANTAIPDLSMFAAWLKKNEEYTKPLGIALAAIALYLVSPIAAVAALGVALVVLYKHSETFRDVVKTALRDTITVFDALKTAGLAVWHALDSVWQAFADGPLAYVHARLADFSAFWQQHSQQISEVSSKAWELISDVIVTQWRVVMDLVRPGLELLKTLFKVAWDVISNVVKTAWNVIADTVKYGEKVVLDFVGVVLDILTGKWAQAWTDGKKLVKDSIDGVNAILTDLAKGALTLLYSAGKDLILGLINGIKSMAKGALDAAKSVVSGAVKSVKDFLGIQSPSKVFHNIGQLMAEGLIQGWTGEAEKIKDALTTPVQNALDHLQTVVDNALTKQKDALKAAQSALKSELATRKSDIASLSSTISGGADLSNVFGTDANGNATVANVGQFLGAQVGPLKTFWHDLALLKKKGLNNTDLSQIAQLGPTEGIQIAQQILSGQDNVSQINQAQAAINKYSTAASTVVTDSLLKQTILKDRDAVKEQTQATKELTKRLDRLLREAAHNAAANIDLTITKGGGLKLSRDDAKEIVRAVNEYLKNVKGGRTLTLGSAPT